MPRTPTFGHKKKARIQPDLLKKKIARKWCLPDTRNRKDSSDSSDSQSRSPITKKKESPAIKKKT